MSADEYPMPEPPRSKVYALSSGVAALTFAVYAQTVRFDFVTYDDGVYVTENAQVLAGLSAEGLRYAFTTGDTGTWQPLALLSHMLDVSLFGAWAGGHHLTNAFLHALSTFVLAVAFTRMTGALGASLFVAAVFGLHPAHVESVAWVSERKDVLSGLFFTMTLLFYAHWARTLRIRWLAIASVSMAAGLLAKPMLVTLPFVLVLLDFWPLRRVHDERRLRCLAMLVFEKVPMFALALGASVATLIVQRNAEALSALDALPLAYRLENTVMSYMRYIGKTLWPADLVMFYPHPYGSDSALHVGLALAALLVITGIAVATRRRAPHIAVGWFWYLGTLFPVIGVVQVGVHAIADRYTYIPMIGLAIMAAYTLVPAQRETQGLPRPGWTRIVPITGFVIVLLLAATTWKQIGVWRNSETLYRHTLDVMPENPVANMGLGLYLVDQRRDKEAIPYLERAVSARHRLGDAHYHLGLANFHVGEFEKAAMHYRHALQADGGSSRTWNNLGVTLDAQGKSADAEVAFVRAVAADAQNHEARYNLGVLRIKLGRPQEAEILARDAIAHDPDIARYHLLLALALTAQGGIQDALEAVRQALRLDPQDALAQQLMASLEGASAG